MTFLSSLEIAVNQKEEWINITDNVQKVVTDSKIQEGICVICVTNTIAALSINDKTDVCVSLDLLTALDAMVPNRPDFRHAEGNSTAHIKSSLIGPSLTVLVTKGALILGPYQGIWYSDYDGPHARTINVRLLGE